MHGAAGQGQAREGQGLIRARQGQGEWGWQLAEAIQAQNHLRIELIFNKATPAKGFLDKIQGIRMTKTLPRIIAKEIDFADFKKIKGQKVQIPVPVQVGQTGAVNTVHINARAESKLHHRLQGGHPQAKTGGLARSVVAVNGHAPVVGGKQVLVAVPVKIPAFNPRFQSREPRQKARRRQPGIGWACPGPLIDHQTLVHPIKNESLFDPISVQIKRMELRACHPTDPRIGQKTTGNSNGRPQRFGPELDGRNALGPPKTGGGGEQRKPSDEDLEGRALAKIKGRTIHNGDLVANLGLKFTE